jgi:hypothetical protein
MLETPSIRWYSFKVQALFSDNPHGADNQQERPIDRDRNPQRLYAGHSRSVDEEIVPSAWRHAGMAGQDAIRPSVQGRLRQSSEIPCRVSSDLHEWRNDGHTVSTRDSVKLKSLLRCSVPAARRKDPVHLYYSFTLNFEYACVG